MRRLVLIAVSVLALAAAAGCAAVPTPFHRAPPPAGLVSVALADDATARQKQEIAAALRSDPAVRSVTYESREQAYRRAKKVLRGRPRLLKYLRPEDMPEAYLVWLTDRGTAKQVIAKVRSMPGVKDARLLPGTPTPRPT